jgi:serine/threonine protein kinase
MGSEIAEALQRAHETGIVHRDLKPSNIMLTKEGRVKVMDFGLAKRVVAQDVGEQETTAALTKEGTTLGTVPYMSPEQLRGEEIDARSDIFSLGILLYEMLLGEHPFRRDTPTQTAAAILEAKPDFLSGSQAGPGGTLHELLVGMLTKDRLGRTQSVEEVRQTLEALLEQVTPSPAPRWLLWAAGLPLTVVVKSLAILKLK